MKLLSRCSLSSVSSDYSSNYYKTLDLMRGVAALAVVWYHMGARIDLYALFQHGYLAVDFFFTLSGFVLAQSYNEKIAKRRISVAKFYAIRLIRLIPLIFLGTFIAAFFELYRPNVTDQSLHIYDTVLALISGCLLIPTLHHTDLEHVVFPLNGPAWSLSLELFANVMFGIWARFKANYAILIFLMIASLCGMYVALCKFGTIEVGAVQESYVFGYPRLIWSFGSGIIIFKLKDYALRVDFIYPLISLVLMLSLSKLGKFDYLYQVVCLLALIPLIIFCSLKKDLNPKFSALSQYLGDVSFPLYAIHYPIVRVTARILIAIGDKEIYKFIYAIFMSAILLFLSSKIHNVFDQPIRIYLSKKLFGRIVQK